MNILQQQYESLTGKKAYKIITTNNGLTIRHKVPTDAYVKCLEDKVPALDTSNNCNFIKEMRK
jgi:hypothetical protein